MKRSFLTLIICAAVSLTSCKNENTTAEDRVEENVDATQEESAMENEEAQEVVVTLESKNNSSVTGTVTFTEENGEVTMVGEFQGLPEGQHAVHLHETGDCSAADASSAGGHWNPTGENHGEWGSESGFHRGDIGNFDVNSEGEGSITFTTDLWCIGCEDPEKNIVDTAVVVHAGADDFSSQPSGAAGNRLACGVIQAQ